MAERRMFSKRIISSGKFMKMPISSQALYFHLGLHADDDGIVEAYTVLSSIHGCNEDDLKVLVSKGFVQVLNEDLVSYITDWSENNSIRADRKIDSIYKDLLLSVNPDVKLLEKRQRADRKKDGQPMDNQWTTNGQPMDGIGKDRIGKDRIGEDSIGKESIGKDSIDNISASAPKKTPKHKHGEYQHILLTDDELNKLFDEYGEEKTEAGIKYVDEYIEMTGKKYKSHYLVLKKWGIDGANKPKGKQTADDYLQMWRDA